MDPAGTIGRPRRTDEPDPVRAAVRCGLAGADGITVPLREDRRHIQDADVERLRASVRTVLNLEMAAVDAMTAVAERIRPDQATLVPERREEITTEGGLDCAALADRVAASLLRLKKAGIRT